MATLPARVALPYSVPDVRNKPDDVLTRGVFSAASQAVMILQAWCVHDFSVTVGVDYQRKLVLSNQTQTAANSGHHLFPGVRGKLMTCQTVNKHAKRLFCNVS